MCGIIAIASPPFSGLSETLSAIPSQPSSTFTLDQITFNEFYAGYSDQSRYKEWRSFAEKIEAPTFLNTDVHPAINPLGAKRIGLDLRWRIEKDLLSLIDGVAELLDDPKHELPPQGVRMGWAVELALRALARLEVRGRDSAGLSIFVWPSQGSSLNVDLIEQESRLNTFVRHSRDRTGGIALTYKVAEEIGALGYNDTVLRTLISKDSVFRDIAASNPGHLLVVGHTRWASTGEISTANAHPVDGTVVSANDNADMVMPSADRTIAVINGDVDNYNELVREVLAESNFSISAEVTTDSKIVPVIVELSKCESIDDKLANTISRLQGSLACVIARLDAPGQFWSFTKGSGQGLYAGVAGDTCILASEVYGCLELVNSYFQLSVDNASTINTLNHPDDALYKITFTDSTPRFYRVLEGTPHSLDILYRKAEITTRDVDRRGYRHYFRKELEESIDSVSQTINGRYTRTAVSSENPEVQFSKLYTGNIDQVIQKIKDKKKRRVVFIGQGSAHIAGLAGAYFVNEHAGTVGIRGEAITAGEFSAHWMRTDLSDTCLVAVSQSGTTTDTNRAVTLARARGATVIGIVNRRNSVLSDLSDVVIYTSDGRDIEMAVASTKAFYAQVVACFLLAQHIGLMANALIPAQVCAALAEVERLPDIMRECFKQEENINAIAQATAIQRRHWSVLGSGTSRISAQEIRIKMSELCYKTASVDFLEDKKHIDLSAEPLIVAPVFDLRDDLIEDVAKEVAIFVAHNAMPVIFCDRGIRRYQDLTAHVVQVPSIGFSLSIVTSALVGHLFAYHTALAIEEVAARLRFLRKQLVQNFSGIATGNIAIGEHSKEIKVMLQDLTTDLFAGKFDSVWSARVASKLLTALIPLSTVYLEELVASPLLNGLNSSEYAIDLPGVLSVVDATIGETTRSIDSVRHQAKTVTVGTTRSGYSQKSVTGQALRDLGVSLDDIPSRVQYLLNLLDEAVSAIPSCVYYRLERIVDMSTNAEQLYLRVTRKTGSAIDKESRFDNSAPISGTKALVVRRRQPLLVRGIRDSAPILVFPLMREGKPVEIVLLHLTLKTSSTEDIRSRLLAVLPQRRELLQSAIEEAKGSPITLSEISCLPLDVLLFEAPDEVARTYR